MSAGESNGAWPQGLTADTPQFPPVPPDANYAQLARHYGTTTAILAAMLPKIVLALEFLRDAGHQMAFDVAALKRTTPTLPPPRPESPSSMDLLEQAKREVTEKLTELARSTPGPKVEAPPENIASLVETSIAGALQKREDASNARFVRWQRRAAQAALLAFVTAIAGAAGLAAWSKAQGHAEGLLEGKHTASAAEHQ